MAFNPAWRLIQCLKLTCGIVGFDESRETKGLSSKSIGQQQAVEKTLMGAEPETIIDAAESEYAEPETVIGDDDELEFNDASTLLGH